MFCFKKRLSVFCQKHIDKFFIPVEESNNLIKISFNDITRRCILSTYVLDMKTEFVISPCQNLNDHD